MTKTIVTLTGSALIALSAAQFAAAAEHHSGKVHHRAAYAGFRNSNAYAPTPYRAPEPDWDRYSGYAGMDAH
jgi:hypothetical protein